jgi:CRP-like cAMP-binding protein
MSFKANSVIYFSGDADDRIFILKSGRVSLNSTDIETGQEIHDYIQTGEFFGVKSALGRYPREETAQVLTDAAVILFSVPEFEAVVSQNTRIIMKMLKVFSTQLRRIHTKVSTLLAEDDSVDPEVGLFNIGQYYLGRKRYQQAVYAFRRYLTYYPSGRFHEKANDFAQKAEQFAQQYGTGKGPNIQGLDTSPGRVDKPEGGKAPSASQKEFYAAMSTFSQQNYADAQREFKRIAETSAEEEYRVKALFELGRCYFYLQQFEACIKHYQTLISKYPKLAELPEALFYIGQSYQKRGDTDRAGSFYDKVLKMTGSSESLRRKVRREKQALEA